MKNRFLNVMLCIALIASFLSCEDEIVNEPNDLTEEGTIDYGITVQEFFNSKAHNDILKKLTSNGGIISGKTDSLASEISQADLLERLDLDQGYINTQDNKELLKIPIRVQGNYMRSLLSLTRGNTTNSYLLTYPDSTDTKLYYVSTLDGLLLQKVTIGADGIGVNEIYNNPYSSDTNNFSGKSNEVCFNTTYIPCSSGLHSFAYGNAGDCNYWNNPSGNPPSKSSIMVACGDVGSGSSSSGTGNGSGQTGGTNGSGYGDGYSDGFDGAPSVKGGDSLVDDDDCVANLDCDQCNFGPIDIDGDCNVTSLEITVNQINNCMGGILTATQKNMLVNNPQVAFDAYSALTITCNPEVQDFLLVVLEDLGIGDEVDFENELIFGNAFKQTKAYCVVKLLTDTNNNLFKTVMLAFTSSNTNTRIRFMFEPLYLLQGGNDTTTEANTSPPDPLGVTTIRFNSFTNSAFDNSLEIATNILHESIHANLFRIVASNNNVPNPLPDYQYQYIVNLLAYYENNNSPMFITSNAQHTFMANFHVGNITSAVRELDGNQYTLDHYKKFGWKGLSQIGLASNPPLVTGTELDNYNDLALIPLNDNHNLSCDE